MSLFPLKPVLAYYAALAQFHQHGHTTEGSTRSAFADLLKKCASPYDWHLVEEHQFKGTAKESLRANRANRWQSLLELSRIFSCTFTGAVCTIVRRRKGENVD